MIHLTHELLQSYVGGQLETWDLDKTVHRGEIGFITLVEGDVHIKLKWFARLEINPTKWVRTETLDYAIDPSTFIFTDIGEGRLIAHHILTPEYATLFPLGGSALDPACVEGLPPSS